MSSVNKAIILGRVGKDPEVKFTADGKAVCNFSVATSEKIKGEERVEWHNVSLFGKPAEIAGEYLRKGSQVYIEGRIQTRNWTDKEGNKKTVVEILGSNITLLGGKPSNKSDYADTSDIPF